MVRARGTRGNRAKVQFGRPGVQPLPPGGGASQSGGGDRAAGAGSRVCEDGGAVETLDPIVRDLLAATGASRVTVRADLPGATFPVVAEACAPGVRSIAGPSTIDLRAAATFRHLERTLGTLVQDDLLATETPPPPELIARYGARAQMLAAVPLDGRLAAFVSVHHGPDPRSWSPHDVAALHEAAARVGEALARDGLPSPLRDGA